MGCRYGAANDGCEVCRAEHDDPLDRHRRLGEPDVRSRGDWAVQGAMNQGDVASWMVSGNYLTRAPARHVLDAGMSYSLQRYDGSNPVALAAVADGNRYAGTFYAIDSFVQ